MISDTSLDAHRYADLSNLASFSMLAIVGSSLSGGDAKSSFGAAGSPLKSFPLDLSARFIQIIDVTLGRLRRR